MRFFFFILLTVSACAQSVGDFSIPYKANSTGPQTLKSWAKANSTLWGTDGSGNPQSITIGSGLSLTSGVLTSSGGGGVGTGTVTSVALTMPNIFSVTGSPITASGTLAASLATQSANAVFAGPTTGTAAAPTFRALVAADIPDLSGVYQPLASALTAFGELANASGVLTNNGSGALSYTATSFGGDSSSYNGQLVKFANSNGSILASTEIKIYQYPSGTNYLNLSPSQIRWFRGASDYCAIIPSEAGSACTFYFPTNPGTHTLALEDGNITGTAGGLSSTLAVTSGGTGQTSYTDGQLIIGNSTGNTLTKATLTEGPGISITNGHGSITIGSDVGSLSILDQVKLSNVFTIGWTNSVSTTTGTGDRAYADFLGAVATGATAGSTGRLQTPNFYVYNPFWVAITTPPVASARWTKPFVMSFSGSISASTTNGKAWFKFEQNIYNSGDLISRGVGIRVTGTSCVGVWHNGTTGGATAELVNLPTTGEVHQFSITSDGAGNITWLVDGVAIATVATGPATNETAGYTGAGLWSVEVKNNADAANMAFSVGAISVRWDY